MTRPTLYDLIAEETASAVIRRYSTSFSLASHLFSPAVRRHVENVYALVRIADEIVDGGARGAGLGSQAAARMLNDFERDTEVAIGEGYSANLVIHAFARTARDVGFGAELTRPFFDSMRMDLELSEHDQRSFDTYVYGSAEVVGLMCLRAFLHDRPTTPDEAERLAHGARRLGAAFQKVNFLRDLYADFTSLGRSYFPGVSVNSFSESDKNRLLDDIDADLSAAAAVMPALPPSSRRAVVVAHGIFTELSARLRRTPAELLLRSRVRVPNSVKLRIAADAMAGRIPRAMA